MKPGPRDRVVAAREERRVVVVALAPDERRADLEPLRLEALPPAPRGWCSGRSPCCGRGRRSGPSSPAAGRSSGIRRRCRRLRRRTPRPTRRRRSRRPAGADDGSRVTARSASCRRRGPPPPGAGRRGQGRLDGVPRRCGRRSGQASWLRSWFRAGDREGGPGWGSRFPRMYSPHCTQDSRIGPARRQRASFRGSPRPGRARARAACAASQNAAIAATVVQLTGW